MTKISLAEAFPDVARQWHMTKNGGLTPDDVSRASGKKVWWQCSADSSHEWQAKVQHRVNGSGCPFCAGKVASKTSSLATIHPELSKEWNPTKKREAYASRCYA
jgi:hypothetical protein